MKKFLFFIFIFAMASVAFAQLREHLTEKEIDWIREEQLIDKRIEVFVKAADRRLLVLNTPDAKQTKKEDEKWGPLPTGTMLELLQDYKKILEEAEEKLDDAFERNSKDPLIIKALKKFKDGATKHISLLQSLESKMKDKRELMALAEAIEEAEAVTKGEVK
jgi:hypothetical protein